MGEIIAICLAIFMMFFGGGGGGQDKHQNQRSSKTTAHRSHPTSVAKVPTTNSNTPTETTPTDGQPAKIPTPVLLPGLIGLGAAAIRQRKMALANLED